MTHKCPKRPNREIKQEQKGPANTGIPKTSKRDLLRSKRDLLYIGIPETSVYTPAYESASGKLSSPSTAKSMPVIAL